MTTNHGEFEILCALAASDSLTKTEHAELGEHAGHCVLCRNRLVEMRQVGFQLFLAGAFKTNSKQLPKRTAGTLRSASHQRKSSVEFPVCRGRLQRARFGDSTSGGLVIGRGNADRSRVAQICCRDRRGRHFACVRTSQKGLFARSSKPCASRESSPCSFDS